MIFYTSQALNIKTSLLHGSYQAQNEAFTAHTSTLWVKSLVTTKSSSGLRPVNVVLFTVTEERIL
jgi:hypothetical protein